MADNRAPEQAPEVTAGRPTEIGWGAGKAKTQRDGLTEAVSWLVGATTLVALILFALGQSLRLPAHFGVEDWLGWTDIETLKATIKAWSAAHGQERTPAAAAYLLIDTALFMPLYGLTLVAAGVQAASILCIWGKPTPMDWFLRFALWVNVLSVPALWFFDAAENIGGLIRLGLHWGWTAGAIALWIANLAAIVLWIRTRRTRFGALAMGLGVATVAAITLVSYNAVSHPSYTGWIESWPHTVKQVLVQWIWLPLAMLWVAWWFGLDLDPTVDRAIEAANRTANKPTSSPGEVRSASRQVAMGVVGRSRYVLAMLAVFGAFTLKLDQGRDVLLALATAEVTIWWWIIMIVGAIGLAMLSHACWLWTRIVGRVKRRGYDVPEEVAHWAGEWARSWARILMLAPMLMVATLIANVAGDAVIAAKDSELPGGLIYTQLKLGGFALVTVGLAYWLMTRRRKNRLERPADYYNSIPSVRALLANPYCGATVHADADTLNNSPSTSSTLRKGGSTAAAVVHRTQRRVSEAVNVLARPVTQPLFALGLLIGVRVVMLMQPETTGTAPPALAVLALSMVWWLGALGFIAAVEQYAVFPWGVLLLGVAGLVGLVSDNHVLPDLVIEDPAAVEDVRIALSTVALAGLVLLAAASATFWLILVRPTPDPPLPTRLRSSSGHDAKREEGWEWEWRWEMRRAGRLVLVMALLWGGMWGLDSWARNAKETALAKHPNAPSATRVAGRQSGEIASTAMASPAPATAALSAASAPSEPPSASAARLPKLLIASEGGGVRAAYWTARILARVSIDNKHWSERIEAMSGVSGGSMGIAVWRACLRKTTNADSEEMLSCIDDGFASLDSLSPLIAGLLFEDVWMRLLPTDWLCSRSDGCGIRSRAMGFEREWMRGFSGVAQRLGDPVKGEPLLFLNSTVVESGNRGVLTTRAFAFGQLPGAEDLRGSGRIPTSIALITAAHTSARFFGTNPLASLPLTNKKLAAAHLVDGGYHDNSGTASLSDLVTQYRANDPEQPIQLVLIRNGQIPASCMPQAVKQAHGQPPKECLTPAPNGRELLMPRDAQRLELFADLLGPAATVLNNLGTGAHGREPVADLTARVARTADEVPADMGCSNASPICLLDQMEDSSLVPLGWSLSRAARNAMDARAKLVSDMVKEQLSKKPEIPFEKKPNATLSNPKPQVQAKKAAAS